MAYKQKDSINNMLNVPLHLKNGSIGTNKNKKYTPSGETRQFPEPPKFVGGTIGIGPGGISKTILRGLSGAKPYVVGGKYYGDILKSGKLTNSNKGLISGIKDRIKNLFN